MKLIRLSSVFILFMVVACGGSVHLNLGAFDPMPEDLDTVNTAQGCESLYESKKWEIAVLEFANNTGYGDMTVKNSQTSGISVSQTDSASIHSGRRTGRGGYVQSGIGTSQTVGVYSSNSNEFMGQFAPSLGTFAQSVTEEAISQLGGVSLVNRSFIDKVMQEQQFQMTIGDPDTAMELGKLSGVKYILTGSVDNIEAKYIAPTRYQGDNSALGQIMSIVSTGYDAAISGWVVSAAMTLNLIDAETGKVMFAKTFKSSKRATQSVNFQPELVISAAKGIMAESVKSASEEFMEVFVLRGYINEMRGGKKVAQINLGSENGIKSGDVLDVYDIHIAKDFLSGDTKCSLIKLNAKIVISDQVFTNGSWGYIEGKEKDVKKVKIGSNVKRSKTGNQ